MKRFSRLLISVVLALMLLLSWQLLASAQDTSFLSSRISRLESENSALRSRLSRLESQVARVSANVGLDYATPSEVDLPSGTVPGTLSTDPMFDRLATLAIELKERIVVLEEQVAELQANLPR